MGDSGAQRMANSHTAGLRTKAGGSLALLFRRSVGNTSSLKLVSLELIPKLLITVSLLDLRVMDLTCYSEIIMFKPSHDG